MRIGSRFGFNTTRLMMLVLVILVGGSIRAEAETLSFEGRVEASTRAYVYSRVEGRLAEVYVTAGQEVETGMVLARLEDDLARLAVQAAEADLMRAEALVDQAEAQLARAQRLSQSGAGSGVGLEDAGTERALARAERRAAEVALEQARTALADTEILAPLAGFIEAPRAVAGAILEFDAGNPPLFEIVQLNPVRVVYAVPYSERLTQLDRTGARSAEALLERVSLELVMEDGLVLAQDVRPGGTSIRVDLDAGTLDVWADVPNPEGLLRPGMALIVRSTIGEAPRTE
ncbi:MAG: efflux RND transporter periplasmic adaptor subunit [Pseudomonadota bacterium]